MEPGVAVGVLGTEFHLVGELFVYDALNQNGYVFERDAALLEDAREELEPHDAEDGVIEHHDDEGVFEHPETHEQGAHHVPETLDLADGSEGPEHSEGAHALEVLDVEVLGDEAGDHDEKVEHVPVVAEVAVLVHEEAEGEDLEEHFDHVDPGKKLVELLVLDFTVERVFDGQDESELKKDELRRMMSRMIASKRGVFIMIKQILLM